VCASSSQTIPRQVPFQGRQNSFSQKERKEEKNLEIGNQLELRPTSKATLMCFLFKFTSRRTSREEQLTIAIKIEARGHRSDRASVLVLIAPNLSFHGGLNGTAECTSTPR
jgi:hypothetical protein